MVTPLVFVWLAVAFLLWAWLLLEDDVPVRHWWRALLLLTLWPLLLPLAAVATVLVFWLWNDQDER